MEKKRLSQHAADDGVGAHREGVLRQDGGADGAAPVEARTEGIEGEQPGWLARWSIGEEAAGDEEKPEGGQGGAASRRWLNRVETSEAW